MPKRTKKLPRNLYEKIYKRFLDLRFSGLENAINAQDHLEYQKERKKLKGYFQSVYGGTHFTIVKNRPGEKIEYHGDDKSFQDAYNNYEENCDYTGKAFLKMYRHYKGKKYCYLITMQDITKQENII